MIKALRSGIMLLTLLLVMIGGMGMVSVCPCHEEVFVFSCSCHNTTPSCDCSGACASAGKSNEKHTVPAVTHHCDHLQMEVDSPTIPVVQSSVPLPCFVWHVLPDFHDLTRNLLSLSQTTDLPVPIPPDPLMGGGPVHAGFQLPLLI